mgnify:CR=1 FL=1
MFFLHKLVWCESWQHIKGCRVSTQTAQLQNDNRKEVDSFVSWRNWLSFPIDVYVGRIYRSHCCEGSPSKFEERSLICCGAFSKNAQRRKSFLIKVCSFNLSLTLLNLLYYQIFFDGGTASSNEKTLNGAHDCA